MKNKSSNQNVKWYVFGVVALAAIVAAVLLLNQEEDLQGSVSRTVSDGGSGTNSTQITTIPDQYTTLLAEYEAAEESHNDCLSSSTNPLRDCGDSATDLAESRDSLRSQISRDGQENLEDLREAINSRKTQCGRDGGKDCDKYDFIIDSAELKLDELGFAEMENTQKNNIEKELALYETFDNTINQITFDATNVLGQREFTSEDYDSWVTAYNECLDLYRGTDIYDCEFERTALDHINSQYSYSEAYALHSSWASRCLEQKDQESCDRYENFLETMNDCATGDQEACEAILNYDRYEGSGL